MYLQQNESLIPFDEDDFIYLEKEFDPKFLEESAMLIEKNDISKLQNIRDFHKPINEQKLKFIIDDWHSVQNNFQRKNRIDSIDNIICDEYDTLDDAENRMNLMISQIEGAQIWTNYKVVEDYQNQLSNQDWLKFNQQKKFDFKTNPDLKNLSDLIKLSVNIGLHDLSSEGRSAAWQLMLGIDRDSEQYKNQIEFFRSTVFVKPEPKSEQQKVESLLSKDVIRTFSSLQLFSQNPTTGQNKLFNVLKVYSIFDSDLGYTQGMSFVCALILICLNHDEELSWVVFKRILDIDDWRRLYTSTAPKLYELTKICHLRVFICFAIFHVIFQLDPY
ncbi:tbc domain containing protein [Stylonychia lemnae]|uniref:Tbc domain containing protein n=1 Tax=Stylonychia lemnae TaxID=5949 RepID=A0A078AR89_STYLE|nr:tbc domain containing protein [Stylonychia lemnae]|eukprot:CDW84734.1 tbc domain containing protein [Stylonychia lemnae]